MKDFKDSYERFLKIDGDNFGACLRELKDDNVVLQFRIRKSDQRPCWISFWKDGGGYGVYESENANSRI